MKVKQTVSLPHDDLKWYAEEHPDGTLSATLSLLLHSYRGVCNDNGVTPKTAAKDAAKVAREIISEGIYEKKANL